MKNRAAPLALIVLAIATLLMIFVILPKISGLKARLQEVADKAAQTVAKTTEKAGQAAPQAVAQLKEKATATLEKMDRLSTGATDAVGAIVALFDNGRMPGTAEFSEARQKAQTVLGDLAAIELPEGIGGDVLANAQKLRDNAGKALALVKELPDDPSLAATAISQLKALFPQVFKTDRNAAASGADKNATQDQAAVATPADFRRATR